MVMVKKKYVIRTIGPSIAYVPLSQGFFSLVDLDQGDKLNLWNWHVTTGRYARGAKGGNTFMHRFLFGPLLPGQFLDHKNGNRLDNRLCNLRIATSAQNAANSKVRSRSGFKGVYPFKDKWQVILTVSGKKKNLGVFADPAEASLIYKKHALIQFGEFMRAE
jgi:hypothetical protein